MANLLLEEKREEIARQVRRQLDALKKHEEGIQIRKEQIDQAQGQLALAQIKFDHQMADNFDIIEAETELLTAKAALLSDETEYISGTYRLRAILGTLVER
jgi:outer membrane protein TolC